MTTQPINDPRMASILNKSVISRSPLQLNTKPQYQVNSFGSADPNFQKYITPNQSYDHYANQPMNPLLEGFAQATGNQQFRTELAKNPDLQASLFDFDNGIKGNAGIFRKEQNGLNSFGTDKDGKPLFVAPEIKQAGDNFKMGEQQLGIAGSILDSVGAFRDPKEAGQFAQYTKIAGSPELQGSISQMIAKGDKVGATNAILSQLGQSDLKNLKADTAAIGFGAYNLVENWDQMNGAQRSMAMSGLALKSFKYSDGTRLTDRVLIGSSDPKGPSLTVGTAMGLAASGVDVMSLMKNWDQLNAIERVTMGVRTVGSMATIAKQMGLIGAADAGGKAVSGITSAQLGALGFQSVPSAGVGAIIGPADKLPPGYVGVGSGTQPNTVIAVPEGHEATTSTMNGSSTVSILNKVGSGSSAALGAYEVYQNWGKGGAEGAVNGIVGGNVMAQGLNRIAAQNPYMMGALVALSAVGGTVKNKTASTAVAAGTAGVGGYMAYQAARGAASGASAGAANAGSAAGNIALGVSAVTAGYQASKILTSDMSDEDKAKYTRRTVEDSASAYFTFGLSAAAQYADKRFFGGKGEKLRDNIEKLNPALGFTDKFIGKGIGKIFGHGNKEHAARSGIRASLVDSGFLDEKYNVTLADGTKHYLGSEGDEGKHEFRNPNEVPVGQEKRSLSDYDVDYTNDLDFTSNLMTTSLMRTLAGGKGKEIDQMAGQLANAALSSVGYGQDMTEENFAKIQANARKMFADQGIKSIEDGYALANQAYAEHRINEIDLMQMQQGYNLVFINNAFGIAQTLMAGRRKGVEVAHEVDHPGPSYEFETSEPVYSNKPLAVGQNSAINTDVLQHAPLSVNQSSSFNLKGGNYWGPPTAGLYQTALENYQDPYVTRNPNIPQNLTLSMLRPPRTFEDVSKMNGGTYGRN